MKDETQDAPPALPQDPERLTHHYEWLSLQSHLKTLFERLGVTCVVDVGANIGYFGQLVRSFGYDGWIVSFEPVSDAFRGLEEAAAGDDRWRLFDYALGARPETREIAVSENTVLSSFLPASDYQVTELGETAVVRKEQVSVRTLDAVMDECLEGIDRSAIFLKLDTQGWDLEVAKGAAATLPSIAAVQSEISIKPLYQEMPGWAETMEFFADRGFELTGLFTVIRDRSLRLIELDCVMARPELSVRR